MLDIGFAELLVVSAVALFVVGPERLPSAIRAISFGWEELGVALKKLKLTSAASFITKRSCGLCERVVTKCKT